MKTSLYAGVDVSAKELVTVFLDSEARPLRPPATFPNTPEGWTALCSALVAASSLLGPDSSIICGVEATGDHHLGLIRTLKKERRRPIQVHELNPAAVRHFAKALLASAKTDRLDAHIIALYLLRIKPAPSYQPPVHIQRLRHLTRFRRFLIESRTALKNRLHNLLRFFFPGYQDISGSKLPAGLLACLAQFPSPHLILNAGEQKLREIKIGIRHRPRPAHVKKLLDIARNAPFPELSTGEQLMIQYLAFEVLQYNRMIAEIDREIANIFQQYFPDQPLSTIPGIGKLTAAIILAEVGDIGRFHTREKFIGYCGLYPRVWQSGKFEARSRMTHKGNRMLKMAFLLASASARQHNPQIAVYYERLRRRGKSKKACGGAIARKLAEIVYALLKKGESWDPEKARKGIAIGEEMAGEDPKKGAASPTFNNFDRRSRPLDKVSSGSSGSRYIIPDSRQIFPCLHFKP